jgi:hypothetical protein
MPGMQQMLMCLGDVKKGIVKVYQVVVKIGKAVKDEEVIKER